MKLNLGCGFDRRDGFVNVDAFPTCEPDVLMDLETVPWPLDSDTFDYVLAKHVLEHVGQAPVVFGRVMRELYRVCRPGAEVEIHVPHFRHETFYADPTHVRAFTPLTFQMMSKRQNEEWVKARANYSMIALMYEIDFEVISLQVVYDPRWFKRVEEGELTRDQLRAAAESQFGIIKELHARLRAVK